MSRIRRNAEQGTAILITMLLTVSLLAGGAVLLGMQLTGTKSVDVSKTRTLALHCAEAGIAATRKEIAKNSAGSFGGQLCSGACVVGGPTGEPNFLSAFSRDIDGDANADFRIHLVDNDDGDANLATDNDQTVYIVSTCIKYGDIKQQVRELVKVTPGATCSETQKNGCNNIGQ